MWRYFKSLTSQLDNNYLSTCNDEPDNYIGNIVKDTIENVNLVVDLSNVDHIEDLHNDETIEYVGHVSTCTELIFVSTP
jgi:hypothetical protein